MADPRSLPDSDPAALGNTLLNDGSRDIFVRVIVVDHNDRLADEHVTF
jgi:hypothetical protein